MTKIEQAEADYVAGLKYKEIAEKYGVSLNTVKSWKTRYGWQKVCTQNKKGVHTKKGAPPPAPKGNQYAKGNRGGHAPPGNHNAMTHGLFAKYLPAEMLEIAEELTAVSPVDILWGNICIKYAAILRAQKIMYVEDKADMTQVLKRQKQGDSSWEEEFELQFAWDKQATFLKAQSAAMKALTNMLKQYEELCRSEMVTEEQCLRVEKLKAEVTVLNDAGNKDESIHITIGRKDVGIMGINKEVNPHFEDFLFDWQSKYYFLVGGYGSSKSYHVALKIILKLLEEKRTALVVREVYDTMPYRISSIYQSKMPNFCRRLSKRYRLEKRSR